MSAREIPSEDPVSGSNRLTKVFLATVAALLISYVAYGIWLDGRLFQTLSSPTGEYSVRLFGQKERPIWLTVNVYYQVLKGGKPYLERELLHSGDAMDISFELGWPNSCWIRENVLEFYRSEDLSRGSNDEIEILNESGRQIKRVRLETGSKILAFDIEPGSCFLVTVPKPKGDYCSLWIEAEFGDFAIRASDVQRKNSANCGFRRLVIREEGIEAIYQRPAGDQTATFQKPLV